MNYLFVLFVTRFAIASLAFPCYATHMLLKYEFLKPKLRIFPACYGLLLLTYYIFVDYVGDFFEDFGVYISTYNLGLLGYANYNGQVSLSGILFGGG